MNKKYLELTKLIRSKQNDHEILKCLSNYHENDIADMLTVMTPKERKRIYTLLGPQKIIVLNEGKLVQHGKHEILSKTEGLYKNMWDAYTDAFRWELNSKKEVKE